MDKKIKTTIKFEAMRQTMASQGYPVKVNVTISDEITNDEACDIAVHIMQDIKASPTPEINIKRSDSLDIDVELDPDQQTIEFDEQPKFSIKEV